MNRDNVFDAASYARGDEDEMIDDTMDDGVEVENEPISLFDAVNADAARDVNVALQRHRNETRSEERADRRGNKKGKSLRKFRHED